MAIFENTNELNTQKKVRQFDEQTGWKKNVMAAVGYNADGTKSTWGKINPLNYAAPVVTGGIADVASGGSDAKKVISENRGGMVAGQLAAGKLAMNFVPGGLAAKTIGGMALGKGQSMAQGGGAGLSGGDVASLAGAAGSMGSGSKAIQGMNDTAATAGAMKSIDDGVADSDILNKVSDPLDEANYSTEADFLEAGGGADALGDAGDVAKGSKFGDAANKFKNGKFANGKFMKGMGQAANIASIGSDVVNVAQSSGAYNKGLEGSKDRLMKQTLEGAYSNSL
jgi:hypothetical protein